MGAWVQFDSELRTEDPYSKSSIDAVMSGLNNILADNAVADAEFDLGRTVRYHGYIFPLMQKYYVNHASTGVEIINVDFRITPKKKRPFFIKPQHSGFKQWTATHIGLGTTPGKQEFTPHMHVLPTREPCSDKVRYKKQLDCSISLTALQFLGQPAYNATDFFIDIGGFLGDCGLAGAWTGWGRKGVFLFDAGKDGVSAFKKS